MARTAIQTRVASPHGLFPIVVGVACLLMCGWTSAASVGIALGSGITVPEGIAWVPVQVQSTGATPATMDVRIQYDPSRLELAGVDRGPTARRADKEVVEAITDSGEALVVITGGLTTLDDGVAAYLFFTVLPEARTGETIGLAVEEAAAADADAVLLPVHTEDGVVTVVPCSPPDPVSDVTAASLPGGVRLQWEPAALATDYVIYRSETSRERDAAAVAVIRNRVRFDDLEGVPPTTAEERIGCALLRSADSDHGAYYWVQAVNPCGESALIGPAVGKPKSMGVETGLVPALAHSGWGILAAGMVALAAAGCIRPKNR